MSTLLIRNARILDPAAKRDETGDLFVCDGRIATLEKSADKIIDAQGAILAPALIDSRVFKVDVAACHAGGIAQVCLMPDQNPILDDPAIIDRARYTGGKMLPVYPFAAATKNLGGAEIAEVGLAKINGAVAVSTGRGAIASALVMQRLLTYAAGLDMTVISHAEDTTLTSGACATESETATRLGLPAAPAYAEVLAVERDIRLAEAVGAKLHFPQITTKEALDVIRAAKKRKARVTCGVTPAHFLLNDISIGAWKTYARLSPPLREEKDREAVIAGLGDGTIDVISSGHDPRTAEDKRVPYAQAAPGMAAAEVLLSLSACLVHNGTLSWLDLFEKVSVAPARIFGIAGGSLFHGALAHFVLFHPDKPWKIMAENLRGRARNTPFDGYPVEGKVLATFINGVQMFG
jgi:dihydroorotase